ncbi:hypothetical protein AB0L40_27165 [Patulibacter sp. NPDC049589]|uniref:hypothetical protein n=1 Tax=Patulibacter sp. NPDC049589 TaxID=3154731 RepID=UPI00342F93ED
MLVAAVLLSVASPLRNELWWSACAILMAVATLASLRRALAYVLVALLANLVAHVVADDLADTSTVGVLGLWIGLPFWAGLAAVIPDRLAVHLMSLGAARREGGGPPVRGTAWSAAAPGGVRPASRDEGDASPGNAGDATPGDEAAGVPAPDGPAPGASAVRRPDTGPALFTISTPMISPALVASVRPSEPEPQ